MNTRLIDYILEATAAGLDISIREVWPAAKRGRVSGDTSAYSVAARNLSK